jgi:RND family efflux transporter MFP subunit
MRTMKIREPNSSLLAALLVVLLLIPAVHVRGQSQKGPPPTPVRISRVTTMEISPQVQLVGTAEPVVSSVVASQIDGMVQRFMASEGDMVKRGDVLAKLDDTLLQIELKGATASKAEADAQLARAKADLRRSTELLATEAIAEKKYRDDLAEVQVLEARGERLQAQIDRLKEEISRKTIRAPFGGYIVKEHIQMGEWVTKGGPVVTMADLRKIEVKVDVPERHVPHLVAGAKTSVRLDALNPETFTGKIAAIIPVGDAAGRIFTVKVAVDNPEGRIKGGMLCRVGLPVGQTRPVLVVPKDAVVTMGQQHLVYTLKDGVARPVPVTLGEAVDSMVAVTGELEKGMPVVTRGNERLQPGQPVQVID